MNDSVRPIPWLGLGFKEMEHLVLQSFLDKDSHLTLIWKSGRKGSLRIVLEILSNAWLGIMDLQSVSSNRKSSFSFPGRGLLATRASEMIDSNSGNPQKESTEIYLTFRVDYEGNEWANKQCDRRDGRS
jgi:hypothetical protein